MRGLIGAWIVCAGIGWSGVAPAAPASDVASASNTAPACDATPPSDAALASDAAPASDVKAIYRRAKALEESGDAEGALQLAACGLQAAPADLDLLRLQGKVMIALDRLPEALAAFQAFLRAGATGKEAQDAQTIVDDLTPVLSTFLDVAVDNAQNAGPARIYLDSAGGRLLCSAVPTCHRAMIPRVYALTAVAERPGFEHWTGQVTVERDQTATLRITFAHKPSLLTVTAMPPGARIAVDGAVYDGPTQIAAGKHCLVVSHTGYVEQQQEITASFGNPVALAVVLVKATDPAERDPNTAVMLSLGGTAASWGVVAAAIQMKDSKAKWAVETIGAFGTLIAPGFGHWYARSGGALGFGLRVLGVTAAAIAFGCTQDNAYRCGNSALAHEVLGGTLVLGGMLYASGTIYDIGTAPSDARDHRRALAGVTVVPTIRVDHGGLTIAGWF